MAILTIFTSAVSAQSAAEIAAIRAEVAAINKNIKSYTKTVKDVDGISTEGAEATYFLSGKGLKKITAKVYGETFQASVEIYYSGELPVFAYQVEKRYNKPITIKGSKVASVTEKRFYYSGEQLIRLMIGKSIVKDGDDYEQSVEGMKDLADKLKAELM